MDDSPWDESADNFKDIEWSRISSKFTNVGSLILEKTMYDDFKRSVIVKESLQERKQPCKKDLTLDLVILEYPLVEN
jgi:hypothetical protein